MNGRTMAMYWTEEVERGESDGGQGPHGASMKLLRRSSGN